LHFTTERVQESQAGLKAFALHFEQQNFPAFVHFLHFAWNAFAQVSQAAAFTLQHFGVVAMRAWTLHIAEARQAPHFLLTALALHLSQQNPPAFLHLEHFFWKAAAQLAQAFTGALLAFFTQALHFFGGAAKLVAWKPNSARATTRILSI